MEIIHVGLPRAGNVWVHTILALLLKTKKKPNTVKSYISKQPIYKIAKNWNLGFKKQASIDWIDINRFDVRVRISSIYKEPIIHWEEYLKKTSVVATHSYFCEMTKKVLQDFSAKIYLIRDPRDMLVSRSCYDLTSYMKNYYPQPYVKANDYVEKRLEELVGRWVFHVSNYLYHAKMLKLECLFYEKLATKHEREVLNISSLLKIKLTQRELDKIIKTTKFESMAEAGYKGHLGQGRIGLWRDTLNEEQKVRAIKIGGPLLKILYSENESYEADRFSESINFFKSNKGREILKNEIKRSQKFFEGNSTYDESMPRYL